MGYSKCPECKCEIDISDCDDTGIYECPKCKAWLSTDYTKRGHKILATVYKPIGASRQGSTVAKLEAKSD